MKNFEFLFAAYGVIWAGVFGYLIFLNRKQTELTDRIERLKAMFKSGEKSE